MAYSKLATYKKFSPNCTKPRQKKIKKIVIHHMAGKLSLKTCGAIFANANNDVSANYGVDNDGKIAVYVDEKNRAWATADPVDHEAVSIEVANSKTGGNWEVSDKALQATINLCVDICKRNGIEKLNYTGDKSGNLIMHKWYAATACPGPYLASKFPYIASEVNKKLGATTKKKVKTSKYAKEIKKYLKATGWFKGEINNKVTAEYTQAIEDIQNKYFKRKSDRDGVDGPNTLLLAKCIYNMRGIKYFDLTELRCNCGKCTGYPAAINRQLMLNMDDLRKKNGAITITSGIRCKHKNSSLSGSSSTSRHMKGKAVDFYNTKLTSTKSKRTAMVKKWYTYKKANYSYANTPGMGNAVHVDVK